MTLGINPNNAKAPGIPVPAQCTAIRSMGAGETTAAAFGQTAATSASRDATSQVAANTALSVGREAAGNAANQVAVSRIPSLAASVNSLAAYNEKPALNYNQLLHLREQKFTYNPALNRSANWQNYKGVVSQNFQDTWQRAKDTFHRQGNFFEMDGKRITPGTYLRETIVNNNLNPVKQLAQIRKEGGKADLGAGLGRIGAFGLVGYDIFRTTKKSHDRAKAQEDGSLKSHLHTWNETGKTFAIKSMKSLASWEAFGVGMAIGKALALPGVQMFGKKVPVLSIVLGALSGVTTTKALDKIAPTS